MDTDLVCRLYNCSNKWRECLNSGEANRLINGTVTPKKNSIGRLLNTYRIGQELTQYYYFAVEVELDSVEFWLWVGRILETRPISISLDKLDRKYATVAYSPMGVKHFIPSIVKLPA